MNPLVALPDYGQSFRWMAPVTSVAAFGDHRRRRNSREPEVAA
jgi:hypothetical protein